ncbi:MAG: aldo/keto reductase [Nocardioides sp.]|nr:aldo/keto reductase [Nocardioides sp.]
MSVPQIALHDGTSIPQLGLGTFQVPDAEVTDIVAEALDIGYRHVDTAQMYGNEAGVGRALAASGIAREDLYVTTKLNNDNHRPDDVRRSLVESLERLGLDRVDLFLIHWPLPTRYDGDFVSTWRAMTEVAAEGLTTSVGVSNFQPAHLDRIVAETGVAPVINQVEVHPFFANEDVRSANRRHRVVTEAWAPIARGAVGDDEQIGEIASQLGRTPAQVALRWHIQRGDVVFPKTTHSERLRSNFDVLDFELSPEQMSVVDGLDRGPAGRMGPDPDVFDWVP